MASKLGHMLESRMLPQLLTIAIDGHNLEDWGELLGEVSPVDCTRAQIRRTGMKQRKKRGSTSVRVWT